MSVLTLDDAEIYFEEYGTGYPVLLFAPGGMRSRLEMWPPPPDGPPRPWVDWTEALADRWHVVALDLPAQVFAAGINPLAATPQ